MSARLSVDGRQIARFVGVLFKHADVGTFISLRAFDPTDRPIGMRGAKFPCVRVGEDIVGRAACAAGEAVRYGGVFCPPIATFTNDSGATKHDVANAMTLTVDCDKQPVAARVVLERLLGLATIVVATGGRWTNPETGEIEDKLHLHWRLAVPARTVEEYETLRMARERAALLIGGDLTAVPPVHPLRWPGSWHLKDPAHPRLATVIAETDAEIELGEAIRLLPAGSYGAMAGKGLENATTDEMRVAQTDDYWARLAEGVDKETISRIDDAIVSILGYLLHRGVEAHLALALVRGYNAHLCEPSFKEDHLEEILSRIMARELGKTS